MGALSFQLHPITVAAMFLSLVAYPLLCSAGANNQRCLSLAGRFESGLKHSTSREKRFFFFGLLALFIANYWPLADMAEHDLLLARMLQQLIITLAAAPFLLQAIPKSSIVALTKPRLLDLFLTYLTRPLSAIVIFTATAVLAMTPALVAFEMSSVWRDQLMHLALLAAALLAWMPILRVLPGVQQLSTPGRLAYLFVLSLLPNIPAIVLIFARRVLYSSYSHAALGLNPVSDQQLTGALAKIASLAVFWGVAIAILLRADRDEELGLDPDPITWDDVKRELDRSAKRFPQG